MSVVKFLLVLLFLPILLSFWIGWIIYWKLFGKKQAKKAKQNQELKQKWSKHLLNFAPSRLKNKTWQKSIGKYKKKTAKKLKNSPKATKKLTIS